MTPQTPIRITSHVRNTSCVVRGRHAVRGVTPAGGSPHARRIARTSGGWASDVWPRYWMPTAPSPCADGPHTDDLPARQPRMRCRPVRIPQAAAAVEGPPTTSETPGRGIPWPLHL